MNNIEELDILLIEDSPTDAELVKRSLKKRGLDYKIKVVKDCPEARDILLSGQTRIKLILLDLKLPKINGNELLREIKSVENIEKTPIVIFTSSKQDKDIVKSYRNGANSYIIKPVDSEKFEDIVSEVCHYWVEINEPAR